MNRICKNHKQETSCVKIVKAKADQILGGNSRLCQIVLRSAVKGCPAQKPFLAYVVEYPRTTAFVCAGENMPRRKQRVRNGDIVSLSSGATKIKKNTPGAGTPKNTDEFPENVTVALCELVVHGQQKAKFSGCLTSAGLIVSENFGFKVIPYSKIVSLRRLGAVKVAGEDEPLFSRYQVVLKQNVKLSRYGYFLEDDFVCVNKRSFAYTQVIPEKDIISCQPTGKFFRVKLDEIDNIVPEAA